MTSPTNKTYKRFFLLAFIFLVLVLGLVGIFLIYSPAYNKITFNKKVIIFIVSIFLLMIAKYWKRMKMENEASIKVSQPSNKSNGFNLKRYLGFKNFFLIINVIFFVGCFWIKNFLVEIVIYVLLATSFGLYFIFEINQTSELYEKKDK